MKQYLNALQHILVNGDSREDRTGTGTIGIFGHQMRFNLQEGFPAVTTKRLAWKAVLSELLWFISGSSNERDLCNILHGTRDDSKSTIWTANAQKQGADLGYDSGELGPVYGVQWRAWAGNTYQGDVIEIDQIANIVHTLKTNPFDRRMILSAWNVAEINDMALPPCHLLAQFHVSSDYKLSCQLYQRSADMFLGVPFNIASYALLVHMLAQVCDLEVGEFIWTGGDCHIYNNHITQVNEQLARNPQELPSLWMNPQVLDIDKFTMSDFKLVDYNPMAAIKAEMSV